RRDRPGGAGQAQRRGRLGLAAVGHPERCRARGAPTPEANSAQAAADSEAAAEAQAEVRPLLAKRDRRDEIELGAGVGAVRLVPAAAPPGLDEGEDAAEREEDAADADHRDAARPHSGIRVAVIVIVAVVVTGTREGDERRADEDECA